MSHSAIFLRERSLSIRTPVNAMVAVVLGCTVLIDGQFIRTFGPLLQIWQYSVYWSDVASVALVILALFGWRTHAVPRYFGLALLLLGLLIAVGVLATTYTQGLETAVVSFRYWILSWSILVFSSVFAKRFWADWLRIVLISGVLSALIVFATALRPDLLSNFREGAGALGAEAFYGYRPLTFDATLLIVASVVCAATLVPSTWRASAMIIVLSTAVTLAQVRSAWLALVTVLVLIVGRAARDRSLDGASAGAALALLVFATFVAAPILTGQSFLPGGPTATEVTPTAPPGSSSTAVTPTAPPGSSSTSTSSLAWRLDLWGTLIEGMVADPVDALVGSLNGVAAADDDPRAVHPCCRTSAHNMFLDTLVKLGVLGVVCVTYFLMMGFLNGGRVMGRSSMLMWVVLIGGLTFMWPTWCWLMLGAGALTHARVRRAGLDPGFPEGPLQTHTSTRPAEATMPDVSSPGTPGSGVSA